MLSTYFRTGHYLLFRLQITENGVVQLEHTNSFNTLIIETDLFKKCSKHH